MRNLESNLAIVTSVDTPSFHSLFLRKRAYESNHLILKCSELLHPIYRNQNYYSIYLIQISFYLFEIYLISIKELNERKRNNVEFEINF